MVLCFLCVTTALAGAMSTFSQAGG